MRRLDNHGLSIGREELLAFLRIRNEHIRLPWFLHYHRQLGVDRFFIVDNGSTDGSTDYLLTQPDVHLFYTTESYAAKNGGMDWINHLLGSFAAGHWSLTVDADELLVFPGIETIGLRRLLTFLDGRGFGSLRACLVDMYSANPIKDTIYQPGTDFLLTCPYFDGEAISEDFRGGARKRLFWTHADHDANPPYLLKIPLVKWRSDLAYEISNHVIRNTAPAPMSGALMHFKLLHDFGRNVKTGVEENQYWNASGQYKMYLSGMHQNPGLSAYFAGSIRYENSMQFVKLGLMQDWAEFASYRQQVIEKTPLDAAASSDRQAVQTLGTTGAIEVRPDDSQRQSAAVAKLGVLALQGYRHRRFRRSRIVAVAEKLYNFWSIRRVTHAVNTGRLKIPALFDANWYLAQYPEVREAGMHPYVHFWLFGWYQGYRPMPLFDIYWYVTNYPDFNDEWANPLEHYEIAGQNSGCRPCAQFDPQWYLAHYPDVREAGIDPLYHYCYTGSLEGRRASADADLPARHAD